MQYCVVSLLSLALDKATEGGQFLFDLLEHRADRFCQRLHFIRHDMIRIDITTHVAKAPVGIEELPNFLGYDRRPDIRYFQRHLIQKFLVPIDPLGL